MVRYLMIAGAAMAAVSPAASAQQPQSTSAVAPLDSNVIESPVEQTNAVKGEAKRDRLSDSGANPTSAGRRFFDDQKQIWTSPRRIRLFDVEWLLPVAGLTVGTILTDRSFSKSLPDSRKVLRSFQDMRAGSVATLAAASGGLYLWSFRSHDAHQRETGMLAGEAVVESLLVTQGIKSVAGRERPNQGSGQGGFFQGGSSFPSNHSAAAWAAAGILAHEYHGPMTKLIVYGLAATVSAASVGSKEHFPSDVLIGSGLGWAISEYVYRRHHDPTLGGAAWNPLKSILHDDGSGPVQYPGSTYVPLDSWVYDAFDRLAALGYVTAGFQGKRPWSREQCVRLLADAEEALARPDGGNPQVRVQASALLQALHGEFAREETALGSGNRSAQIDSVYARVLSANGRVLDDGYHFGETFAYDFGRPFRQGTNLIAGGSASATYGSLFFFVNGEYQQAPSAPALSTPVREFIASEDKVPLPADTPFLPINHFRLLDAYVGINLHGWQFSFGNQSLSWGPGPGGSLLLSDNAAPFPMLRMSQESPWEVPILSHFLGPFSAEQFFGRLEGHAGLSQPWIFGQKISIKPLRSLEFAYARTTVIGGSGHPLTAGRVFSSLIGRVDPGENSVPGDSRSSVEWTWRPPGLHDWATLYGELENDDDVIPLENPPRSVLRPGIYFPHLPLLPKLDLHFEWTSSTTPGRLPFQSHGHLNYWNLDYTDGYTNDGNLMANTVGREGVTSQVWCRYWISPRHTLDFTWKQSRVLSDFVPGGGKWQDFRATYSVTRPSGVYAKNFVQFEHISSFPLLFPGSKTNVTAAVEVGFLPQWGHQRRNGPSGGLVP